MERMVGDFASIVTVLTGVVSVLRFIFLWRQKEAPSTSATQSQTNLPFPQTVSMNRKIGSSIKAIAGIGCVVIASLVLLDEIFSGSNGAVDTEAIAVSIVFVIIGIVILYTGRTK